MLNSYCFSLLFSQLRDLSWIAFQGLFHMDFFLRRLDKGNYYFRVDTLRVEVKEAHRMSYFVRRIEVNLVIIAIDLFFVDLLVLSLIHGRT